MSDYQNITHYLSQLPDGYRERALANHEKEKAESIDDGSYSDGYVDDIHMAIIAGFGWAESPEGAAFWIDVSYHHRTGEIPLPPLP